MKMLVGLCFLALAATALADCGCLKCSPNLQVVSPRYSPCKVIYRTSSPNCPSRAPYTLQKALPPPPPLFIPKEYDYQLQVVPLNQQRQQYGCSTYEYGLQAAVPPPPPTALFLPLKNLRTATERVVMDSPACGACGGYRGSTCNPGFYSAPVPAPAPLPLPLPVSSPYQCGCQEEERECDCRGPIIEPLCPSLCPRYARSCIQYPDEILRETYKKYRDSFNCKRSRRKRFILDSSDTSLRLKRDLLELPMNFMFNFVPKLLKAPIIHAMNTIHHAANPAVIRARANAGKHIVQSHLAKAKHKHKLLTHSLKNKHPILKLTTDTKSKHHTNSIHDKLHKSSIGINLRGDEERLTPKSSTHHTNKHPKHQDDLVGSTNDFLRDLFTTLTNSKKLTPKVQKINPPAHLGDHVKPNDLQKFLSHYPQNSRKDLEDKINSMTHQNKNLVNKFNQDVLGHAGDFLRGLLSNSGPRSSLHQVVRSNHHPTSDKVSRIMPEEPSSYHQVVQSPEELRDIFLDKLKKFNEMYERQKRSSPKIAGEAIEKKQNRRKRSILLDNEEFSLPFFEIDDEVLDEYNNGIEESEEQVATRHRSRRRHRKAHHGSEIDSDEDILGASHPLHEHPFVVLLKAPLKFLHHFHDIRKNFRPILYSFPKLLHSSKKYLRDFGKNLQTGVLDFASNVMGDFDHGVPKRYDPLLFPPRLRRSVDENPTNLDASNEEKLRRNKRYILKVVDEEEVQEFLKEKLGGYFDDDDDDDEDKKDKSEECSKSTEKGSEEETVGKSKPKTKIGDKRFVVKKLSPKIILDNNGKPFIEINGNKRPLFYGKHKEKHPVVRKSNHNTHKTTDASKSEENEDQNDDDDINDRIDDVIKKAKRKLNDVEILQSTKCDEMPAQTVKDKISQISTDIQNLMNLDFDKYSDLYENLLKLDNLKNLTTEYWKNVMINEKTNEIHCKIKILNYFREMQVEKDKCTKVIAQLLKTSDNFIVKKMIKLLVRLQKLQCLIQKVVDHFDNRMKIGTTSDTEKEIKFVDYLSTLSFVSGKNREELECTLKKEKNEALKREIRLLENLRILLQKDDTYTINEVAKQIWETKNIEKLQQEAIEEMNNKIKDNMKIRKELKILFDLLKQIETSEETCEKLLLKIETSNIVGSRNIFRNGRRVNQKPTMIDILQKIKMNRHEPILRRNFLKKSGALKLSDL